jgi:hypothetical protein
MDPHIRWMRRFLLSRVAARVSVEATVVGAGAGAGAWYTGSAIVVSIVLGLLVAQAVGGLRLALAVLGNPVNHRYLLAWSNPAGRLRPVPAAGPADPRVASSLTDHGFGHVLRLESGGHHPIDERPDPAGEDESGTGGIDVFRAASGLVLVAAADDGETTVLSKLSDGRAVVTATGFVPPRNGVVVGRHQRAEPLDLVMTHVERLEVLRATGAHTVVAGPGLVLDQIRAEWEAWQELGPFIGPLVATGEGRRNPLLLQVRIPEWSVWDRSRSTTPGPTPTTLGPLPTIADASPGPALAAAPTAPPAPRNWYDPPSGPPAARGRRRTDRFTIPDPPAPTQG